jgi:arylsulfatase A-like enzyme
MRPDSARPRADRPSGASMRGCAVSILMLLAASTAASTPKKTAPPRNVLLVVVDTLRYDAGIPGTPGDRAAVPAFLHGRGHHFDRLFAAATWTMPSMSALLSGNYPSEDNALLLSEMPRLSGRTLPERLRSLGYATAAVLSNPLLDKTDLERGIDSIDARTDEKMRHLGLDARPAPETTKAALAALASLSSGGKPWFLWVHYFEPHGPYLPPKPLLELPENPGAPLPVSRGLTAKPGALPEYQFLEEARGRFDYVARYRAYARYAVSEVDRFLDEASRRGLLANTIIVYTADHGEMLGEDNFWCEHGNRIHPVVVHVPAVIALGDRDPLVHDRRDASNVDFLPSLICLVTGRTPNDTRGQNLFQPGTRELPVLVERLSPGRMRLQASVGVKLPRGLVVEDFRQPAREYIEGPAGWREANHPAPIPPGAREQIALAFERLAALARARDRPTAERLERLKALGYLGGSR